MGNAHLTITSSGALVIAYVTAIGNVAFGDLGEVIGELSDDLTQQFFQSSTITGTPRNYSPIPKHEPGGWGTEMDLDLKVAEKVLNEGIPVPGRK